MACMYVCMITCDCEGAGGGGGKGRISDEGWNYVHLIYHG